VPAVEIRLFDGLRRARGRAGPAGVRRRGTRRGHERPSDRHHRRRPTPDGACQYWTYTEPRTWVSSHGLGTMGYGLPSAIGARLAADDDQEVVCIDGDGSFLMTLQGLSVAVRENLDITVAVLNNEYIGMVRQWQDAFFDGRHSASDYHWMPEFDKIRGGLRCERVPDRRLRRCRRNDRRRDRLRRPVGDRRSYRSRRQRLPDGAKRRRQRSVRTDGGPAMTSERATHLRCHAHRDATRVTVGQTASDCKSKYRDGKAVSRCASLRSANHGCFA